MGGDEAPRRGGQKWKRSQDEREVISHNIKDAGPTERNIPMCGTDIGMELRKTTGQETGILVQVMLQRGKMLTPAEGASTRKIAIARARSSSSSQVLGHGWLKEMDGSQPP
jgi:hypothetical protein